MDLSLYFLLTNYHFGRCFAGGMLGLGSKLLSRPKDMLTALQVPSNSISGRMLELMSCSFSSSQRRARGRPSASARQTLLYDALTSAWQI